MSASDNLAANSDKVAYTDFYETDKVVFSDVFDTTVPNSVGIGSISYGSTGISGLGRPLGIYTFDGGTIYNDFIPLYTSFSGLGSPVSRPSVAIQPEVSATGSLSFRYQVFATVGGGSTIPLSIKIAILSEDSPASMNQLPQQSNENIQSFTTLSSGLQTNYRQVLLANSIDTDVGGVGTFYTTVAHGAGEVPIPRVNVTINTLTSPYNTIFLNYWDSRQNGNAARGFVTGMLIDATNLYIEPGNQFGNGGRMLYRVYRKN